MNEYRAQRLKEDLTFAQQRNKRQRQQLANYKKVHEKDLKEIERLNNIIERLNNQLQQKENIIKEVREYITSYESIETIQQFDHNKNNEDLDYSTIDEMTRRYMMVHDKILKILDK